jgi:type I restriction enzyme S subunit
MSAEMTEQRFAEDDTCPPGWDAKLLWDVAPPRFSNVNKITAPGELPVRLCNYIDVYNNDYIGSDMEFMHATATCAEIDRFRLEVGDVIITKDSETPDDIGVPAVVESTAPDLVCGYHLALLRPRNGDIDPTFLAKQLAHPRLARYFGRQANGSTRYGLSTGAIERAVLHLPRPDLQRAAGVIFRLVDAAIAKTADVVAKLKNVRAGLQNDLLTYGLDEAGKLRDPNSQPNEFMDSRVERIPKAWRCSLFDDLLERIEAGNSPDLPDCPAPPGQWGVLKVSAIWPDGFRPNENKWTTKANHHHPSLEVRDGDLLISRSNTYELVGLVCIVANAPPRLMLCDKTLRLRLKPHRGLNRFFALLLQTRTARKQIEVNATGTSGSMKNISQDVIRSLWLPYPDTNEQARILTAIQPVQDELSATTKELEKLQRLKTGLASDLLTGRVPVPDTIEASLP